MMSRIFALLATTLLLAIPTRPQLPTAAPNAKTDKDLSGLNGPVETVSYEWAVLKSAADNPDEYLEQSRVHVNTVTYDKDGNQIKVDPPRYKCGMYWYEALSQRVPTYDDNGHLIEEVLRSPGRSRRPNDHEIRRERQSS
jgi:hypothetical protein